MAAGPGNGDGGVDPVARIDEHQAVERVRIKVNGVEIEVKRKVEVREIIVKAKKADAIEGFVEEYVIERVKEGGEIGFEETITVIEQERFLAVPVGKTEVA